MSPKKGRTHITSPARPTSTPHINLPETVNIPITLQHIMFSIECCSGKCCYKKIKDKRDKADFADRLHELSQLTWGQINDTSRKGLGYETLDDIKIVRSKIPSDRTAIAFIYHDYHRMWGYRDLEGIFHITGFDYDGRQYKH
jgi:hypothetical protein